MQPDYVRAYKYSTKHSAELLASELCGCFHCMRIFPPMFITHWVDKDEDGVGQTALCPHCGMDTVLGSASGFELTPELLQEMHRHWFGEQAKIHPEPGGD